MKIYVGNLPCDAGDEQLAEAFKPYGDIECAKIVDADRSGRSLKFGIVHMENDQEGRAAIYALNGIKANGVTIVVKEALQRSDHGLDVHVSPSYCRLVLGGCQKALDWLRGDFRLSNIWLCKVGARPRVGTENDKQYQASLIYCFIQTKMRDQALDHTEVMVDENGWVIDSTIDCCSVTRSTVPPGLVSHYKIARSEGDSIAVFPRRIDLVAVRQP